MKSAFKIISLILVVSMLLTLTACFDYSYIDETVDTIKTTDPQIEEVATDKININLPYITSDSLDPFKAKTETNQSLTSIMYDSLFSVDNSFKAQPLMAESFSLDGNVLSVKLKSGLFFSDLGSVSANDVVYSFEKSKETDRYKGILSAIKGANASTDDTIIFTLKSSCNDPCSLLTFPIVKTGSKSGDNKTEISTGSGRYILSKNENNELYLTAFSKRLGEFSPIYTNIGLVSTSDSKAASSTFSLGHTNVLIDSFSQGDYQKYIGATNKVNLTNLVYLVCNNENEILKDSNVKKAISLAINRNEIVDYSFMSFAGVAYSPFHKDYYKIADYDFTPIQYNTEFSNKILDSIGYKDINKTYNFRHNDGKVMEFDLVVSKENSFKLSAAQIIKTQLKDVSIYINLKICSQEEFFKAVSSGKYDMYIGECKLTNSFDLSPFFDKNNSVSNGIPNDTQTQKQYQKYLNGEISACDFIDSFCKEMPFIPLLYRSAAVNSNSAMAVSSSPIVSDYYNNIDKWKTVND